MNEKRHKTIKEPISSSGENGQDCADCILLLLPEVSKTTEQIQKKMKEWETTKARKKIFIGIWKRTLGAVKATCEKANVARRTFYYWMHNDPEFAAKINGHFKEMLEDIDQAGKLKILEGDSAMIRFYLERLHPMFKPKVKIEGPAAGERSLEEEFDMMKFVNDNELYGEAENKQLDGDSKPVLDKGQTGSAGSVQT